MKLKLESKDPVMFRHFQKVWKNRNDHMVANLPPQYIFYLICCFKDDCTHPICCSGTPPDLPTWYPGGPSLYCLPIPTPDPNKCWGDEGCSTCREFCAGHYKEGSLTDVRTLKTEVAPPTVLKRLFTEEDQQCFSDIHLKQAAKATLLPTFEVKIWLDHLKSCPQKLEKGCRKSCSNPPCQKRQPIHII